MATGKRALQLGIEGTGSVKLRSKGHVNPMFDFSSSPNRAFSVSVHYGSAPLLDFHLAEVFYSGYSDFNKGNKLTDAAKPQFRNWCSSFSKHIHTNTVKVAVHCGEAVSLYYDLQNHQPHCQSLPKCTRRYDGPWSERELTLWDPEGIYVAKQFDVTNTSNLNDHVGILNILQLRSRFSVMHVPYCTQKALLLPAERTSESRNALIHSDIIALSLSSVLHP